MPGSLSGLRVVELSRFRAAAMLGMVLADHGAEVVRVPLPAPPLAAASMWLRGRIQVALDLQVPADQRILQRLVRVADVVIDDLPADGWRPEVPPSAIVVRLPVQPDQPGRAGFGELAAAVSGLYATPTGLGPQFTPLAVAGWASALYAAIGVCAALLARQRDGRGQVVTVPQSDAIVSVLELIALFTIRAPTRWSPIRWAATPFIGPWRCADDRHLYVHAGIPSHAATLLAVLGLSSLASDETRADPGSVATPSEARRLKKAIGAVFRTETARHWEERLSGEGLCAVEIRSLSEWMAHPHPAAAGHVVELDDPEDGAVRQPGLSVWLSETPGTPRPRPAADADPDSLWTGEAPWHTPPAEAVSAPPLAGVVVLDVTQVIAGPTAARTLGELGARVVRVENPRLGVGWVEPFHVAYNPGKESLSLDVSTEEGQRQLQALLQRLQPDVVIENFRQGVAARLGVRSPRPDSIHASMTAYGPAGPWAGRPGWEQTAQAATGMQADWGGSGVPTLYPQPVNDFATGLSGALAVLLGLLHRARTGAGQEVATSLAATALHLQSPYACRPDGLRSVGASQPGHDPLRRFYRARDGWCFLAAAPGVLETVPGLEGLATSSSPAAFLASALRTQTVATWQARQSGRMAGVVRRRSPRAVLTDPDGHARGILIREAVPGVGEITRTGPALQLSATPLVHLGPAHQRGRDTVEGIAPAGALLPAKPSRTKVAWLLEQARWAAFLALGW